ncbi:MAG: FtsH protease activity modulator HflK [Thermodesulfobacteriota bacterium]
MSFEQEEKEQQPAAGPGLTRAGRVLAALAGLWKYRPRLWVVAVLALVAWVLSGIFIVAPDETGLVKRFGRYKRPAEPGPHYHFPYPIERAVKARTNKVHRLEIGFRTVAPGSSSPFQAVPEEALMLTGDEKIVDLWFVVHYRINDAQSYLFHLADPVRTIQTAAEAAMREAVGRGKIETALADGKQALQEEAAALLQERLDAYESGLKITYVLLQAVNPPAPVQHAFKEVVSAREEKNKLLHEAKGYANDLLPQAKGQAAQVEEEARAYQEERVKRAQGDAARFLALLAEYRRAGEVTRKRLYLEAMEEVLARAGRIILNPDQQAVLQLLPLEGSDLRRPGAAAEATAGGK